VKPQVLFGADALASQAWSTIAVWVAFVVSLMSAIALVVIVTVEFWEAVASPDRDETPIATSVSSQTQAISRSVESDFHRLAESLPADDADAVMRYAIRAAKNQQVAVSQLRGEPVRTEYRRLGQVKFSLQLRGDYVGIKNVLADVLGAFPGMTLQHLSIRHGTASAAGGPIDGGDEASLELLQFLRPATLE
jgi:hypothetical protein